MFTLLWALSQMPPPKAPATHASAKAPTAVVAKAQPRMRIREVEGATEAPQVFHVARSCSTGGTIYPLDGNAVVCNQTGGRGQ